MSATVTAAILLLSAVLHHVLRPSAGDPAAPGASASDIGTTAALVQDYCQWEAFNASCPHGHVIVMQSAKFGRMRLGRCVDTDIYIGCAADVLALFDARCSGRPSCVVQLPDATLHQQQACPKDVVAYLEASYVCVDASRLEPVECAAFTQPKLITADVDVTDAAIGSRAGNADDVSGYLASYYAQTLGHGRPDCPWTIAVRPGQRIQLTLIDFTSDARYRVDSGAAGGGGHESPGAPPASAASAVDAAVQPDFCYRYAQVSEGASRTSRRYTVCAEDSRQQVVYTSSSNRINVEITDTVLADAATNFLIKYTVVGCANLEPPADAWVERTGDRTTVSCNKTTQSWHLVCKGTTWVGPHTHDCQHGSPFGDKITDDPPFPTYGLVIAVIIGVVVGSVCGFLLLALVLSCRRQRALNRSRRPLAMTADIPLMLAPPSEHNEHVCKLHGVATTPAGAGHGQYGYTQVWQLRAAPDVAIAGGHGLTSGDYQATDNVEATTSSRPGPAPVRRGSLRQRDHLYDCPLFDDRLLVSRLQTGSTHIHSPGCRRHQYQHHSLCPHARQVSLPVSSPVPPPAPSCVVDAGDRASSMVAVGSEGSPRSVGGDADRCHDVQPGSQDDEQAVGDDVVALDDARHYRRQSASTTTTNIMTAASATCRTEDVMSSLSLALPPPDVTTAKSTSNKATQNHYL